MVEYILNLQLFADANVQTTATESLSAEMKTYYERRLLDAAEPNLVHDQFGDKYPIPAHGGKNIEFRKYSALPVPTQPLTEGVTPDGSSLSVSTITGTVSQWGDYVTISDQLELTAIDRNVEQATKLLGSQAGKKLDQITRDVMATGGTVHYPDGAEGRANITAAMPLTVKMIMKAAANLRANNAPEINGDYVAIVHPYVAFDLMSSDGWLETHKYAQPDEIYEGEIGKIGGVRFVETSEAKIFAGAGASGADVYCTFVLGAGAYGVTEVAGGGLQHIVKQMGAGDDPLNQRATTGWKALKTAEILEDQYMVRIEHGCTFK
jgi:N4-gp56 family major capsid protein